MKHKHFRVTKASGNKATFSVDQLRHSLLRSGADNQRVESIIDKIIRESYEGIPTKLIYRKAYSLLKGLPNAEASRYKLKNAILELGPTGFPFEQFIGRLLKHMGYEVKVGQVVKGHCVTHEVDVIAQKDQEHFMIECKFHNQKGFNCDVKIPLYISARFWDIEKNWKKLNGHENKIHQAWLVTNTRFSDDAISYGLCSGLKLIGWDFPKGNSLKDLIDRNGLHPITSLSTLTKFEKQTLLDNDIVLCSELKNAMSLLSKIVSSEERVKKIDTECHHLCTEMSRAGSVSV
ncbi:MAG: restriction endonuclease [Chitinophagales bacterium]|nr:restriction endonuclease [Chitinophagales bacterium]